MSLYPDKKAMLNKIYELGPRTVSLHWGDHTKLNVIDAPQVFQILKVLQFMETQE